MARAQLVKRMMDRGGPAPLDLPERPAEQQRPAVLTTAAQQLLVPRRRAKAASATQAISPTGDAEEKRWNLIKPAYVATPMAKDVCTSSWSAFPLSRSPRSTWQRTTAPEPSPRGSRDSMGAMGHRLSAGCIGHSVSSPTASGSDHAELGPDWPASPSGASSSGAGPAAEEERVPRRTSTFSEDGEKPKDEDMLMTSRLSSEDLDGQFASLVGQMSSLEEAPAAGSVQEEEWQERAKEAPKMSYAEMLSKQLGVQPLPRNGTLDAEASGRAAQALQKLRNKEPATKVMDTLLGQAPRAPVSVRGSTRSRHMFSSVE